jgi:hypothetical protein
MGAMLSGCGCNPSIRHLTSNIIGMPRFFSDAATRPQTHRYTPSRSETLARSRRMTGTRISLRRFAVTHLSIGQIRFVALVLMLVTNVIAYAQSNCAPVWNRIGPQVSPINNGDVFALATLPNGQFLSGGAFAFRVGGSSSLARWDGATWLPLGSGVNPRVNALATLPNGNAVVGGTFTSTRDGTQARYVARWDGNTWFPLGSGLNDTVLALAVLPNGNLVASGLFTTAGGAPANRIAVWDGTTWMPLGTGLNGDVHALLTLADGTIVAGGSFTTAGGTPANRVARWTGATWSALGAGIPFGTVRALAQLSSGDIAAAGDFQIGNGTATNHVARWNGTTWQMLGSGLVTGFGSTTVNALAALPNGNLVAGGTFAGGFGNIARWDGVAWRALGTGTNGTVRALTTLPRGDIVAGGFFSSAGALDVSCIARWGPPQGCEFCPADFNADARVDLFDYLDFVSDFAAAAPNADFNSDATIDFFDYLDFVAAFSAGC